MQDMQPGQIIVPHNSDEPQRPIPGAPPADRPDEQPGEGTEPIPTPSQPGLAVPAQAQVPDRAADPALFANPDPESGWYGRQPAVGSDSRQPLPDTIGWTASEFLAHEKSAQWYGSVIVLGLLAATVDYLLTRDKISAAVIVFAALAFGVISARKPRTQQYSLTPEGLQIGTKAYYFQDFKNFSVAEEGAIVSIVFMPLKRFMPALTIYVAPDMEDQVIDFLSELLPFERHKADPVDSLLRRIRF